MTRKRFCSIVQIFLADAFIHMDLHFPPTNTHQEQFTVLLKDSSICGQEGPEIKPPILQLLANLAHHQRNPFINVTESQTASK